ncbi:MAG: nucleotidyltransferase [Alphaproteobacteria bacterium]|nr:nucleotidyltransferase [Alphaproteobacteria bacterium]NDC55849.1 nucleotidyltransferase [Alphaproteobacteria bacterium]NDG04318.1 nucleotidyltransferase [Alphaproteobacteria bacterium]
MTTLQRLQERRADFRQALQRLREAMAVPEDSIVRDAIIQRFEFTFELAWKMAQAWLALNATADAKYPRAVWQAAFAAGLVTDGDGWSTMLEMRNLTSHTYDEQHATKVVDYLRKKGLELFSELESRMKDSG